MKGRRQRARPASLLITPMIDMFTVILIFLVATYSPESAKIKKSDGIEVPKSELQLNKAPRIQIEVTKTYLQLNGKKLEGIEPSNFSTWKVLKEALLKQARHDDSGKLQEEPVLIIADKDTSYSLVDRTVGHVAAAGYSEVYFLTENQQGESK